MVYLGFITKIRAPRLAQREDVLAAVLQRPRAEQVFVARRQSPRAPPRRFVKRAQKLFARAGQRARSGGWPGGAMSRTLCDRVDGPRRDVGEVRRRPPIAVIFVRLPVELIFGHALKCLSRVAISRSNSGSSASLSTHTSSSLQTKQ